MHKLSQSDLQQVSGGIDEMRISLEALTATVGYLAGRYGIPSAQVPDRGATAAGAAVATIGCGTAGHLMGNSPRFSDGTETVVGTVASFLCSMAVGVGESVINEMTTFHYRDDDWPYR